MFERIIVPLDGSRLSADALPYAAEIARQFKSEVCLLRVVTGRQVAYAPEPGAGMSEAGLVEIVSEIPMRDVENAAHAKRYLMNRARELRNGGVQVTFEVKEGAAAQTIIDFAADQNASLIVMMSHGRGRLKRALLGSVTDAIMRGSAVPVLVVRAKDIAS
jgi:nucleotide-binding universal stress UspA family protein